MKQILVYGDSLTWGADPATGLRHPVAQRWPNVLQAGLGAQAHVIQDGLGGRTTCFDDHAAPCCRNAVKTLPVALMANMPLDLVIVMLGTNDLKPVHGGVALGAQAGMRRLVQLVATLPYKPATAIPQMLIVAPPLCRMARNRPLDSAQRIAESRKLSHLYEKLSVEMGVAFFDASRVAEASEIDGVHLDQANTSAIGAALVAPVRTLLARA
ncbi:hypothetical protein AQS8620_00675 [Aquimixticola soesokkakensis]|uniref:SGNH hydrolase-type esterase domain-containing protein n=1 Tax=Aquimixticola soesokkakensis TaxID=1519096 RepID=A0A1Y5RT51_9RHOB|nr:SGNH/GDSL hydrolase family protein [Aquimixticola soesokkakensis]SLN23783.1 hypothetical protein AQS8620_00675 [Aquimixticola soesokkakensis]